MKDAQWSTSDVDGSGARGQADLIEELLCQRGKLFGLSQEPLAFWSGRCNGVANRLISAPRGRWTSAHRGFRCHELMVRLPGWRRHL
jgi:hypothetical protein